nr:hypothetical protein [Actinomycetota bacterium]
HIGMPVHVVGVDGEPPNPEARLASTTTTTSPEATTPPTTAAPTPTTAAPTTTVPGLLGGLLKPT